MNCFFVRAGLGLALVLSGAIESLAAVPQARINPIPVQVSVGSATDIRFAHISTADGLSQIHVSNMIQDDLGYMWFGTLSGLNRFDGYSFKVFTHERANSNSLGGVDITSLFKGRDGLLWIGSEEMLDRFNPRTETFTHYPVPMVKRISQDRSGALWFSSQRGLYRLDQKSGKFRIYVHDPNDPASLPDNDVLCAAEDSTGRFWVAEPFGMYELDRATGRVKLSIPLRTGSRDISFYEDRSGGFWIIYGTGNGLAKFDRQTNMLTYYSFNAGDLANPAPVGVTAMLEDLHGDLWFSTRGHGLLKYDRKLGQFAAYTYKPDEPDGISENRLLDLFQDRDGLIWLAMFQTGLQRFSPVPTQFRPVKLIPKEEGISRFFEDSHRNIWVGKRFSLHRVDPAGKDTVFSGMKPGVPFDAISFAEDRRGFIWVGTTHGLVRLDPRNGSLKSYRHDEKNARSLSNDLVDGLLLDRDGTLWVTTWNGLNRLDRGEDGFTRFTSDPRSGEVIYTSMAGGRQHDLWLGTNGHGLEHLDTKTGKFAAFESSDAPGHLSDREVNWVHVAKNGAIWVATSNGLNRFDQATGRFTTYDMHDGLASTLIDCLQEDGRGRLWMSTNKGITSFDPLRKVFRNYSTTEGLPGPEMAGVGSCIRTRSGQMYFAGFSGDTTFTPETISGSSYVPHTVITDFRLLGNPQSPAARIAAAGISYASHITLSHAQPPFSMTFAALAYSNAPANRYRYMLEGLDSAWTEVSSGGRTVTYTSLPARNYRFRVQGAVNGGKWDEPGAALSITILPPWWNTWWFRTMYILAALSAAWLAYRYRMRQVAEQFNIRLDAQVSERMRIARDLHDTMLQSFQGAIFQFQAARKLLLRGADNAMQVVDEAIRAAEEGVMEGRNAIRDLRPEPAAQRSLPELLNAACGELATAQKLDGRAPGYQVLVEGRQRDLSLMLQDEVYRIFREVARNAFMHAAAANIEIEIRYDNDQLRLRVRDDGCGITPEVLVAGGRTGHFGIPGMRERAQRIGAQLDFWSERGVGTEVQLTVPAAVAYEKRRGRSQS